MLIVAASQLSREAKNTEALCHKLCFKVKDYEGTNGGVQTTNQKLLFFSELFQYRRSVVIAADFFNLDYKMLMNVWGYFLANAVIAFTHKMY